jgi:phosphoribosylformylglycinamidine synthase
MFDSSIGASSVLMPYGGKYQLSETQSMIAKFPTKGTNAVSMMSFGFDPYLSSWSPYHGAAYAILKSVARNVAAGGDYRKIRFTFQEYYRRMNEDPKRWSQPFAALLGAYSAQIGFGLPSIGGKDSMSGSFHDIDVPPTLVSFAVNTAKAEDIISPELKQAGNKILNLKIAQDEYSLPVYEQVKALYGAVYELIQKKAIVSAYALDGKGMVAALSKMAFGNKLGVTIDPNSCKICMFSPRLGNLVAEVPADKVGLVKDTVAKAMDGLDESVKAYGWSLYAGDYCKLIGEVNDEQKFIYGDMELSLEEALSAWKGGLETVFQTKTKDNGEEESPLYEEKNIYLCKHKVAKPKVFIPVFPGTNCEYDSARAFERAGAETSVIVFKNQNPQDIRESVEAFAKAMEEAQIVMFPGGFSAGDEPEGSAKFFATAFRNERLNSQIEKFLQERDGLMLGICNGFQALIKLGLLPYGEINPQSEDSPTLTYNTIGRHVSKMAYTKVVSNKSPWLAKAELGMTYSTPVSHGEGRFVANEEWLNRLFANGQVATQYVDFDGNASMDVEWNVNGSYRAIEGITSADGRIFGKMAHVERRGEAVAINVYGEQDLKIFEAGVEYFR